MNGKNLIVLFPGTNYSVDMPLLYYANFKYMLKGYDQLKISYGDYYSEGKSMSACVEDIKTPVLKQVKDVDFSQYDDIVFVSKSIGTVIAGWLEDKLNIKARHIYLTPIEETLPYIKKDKNIKIVVSGTEDRRMNSEVLKKHCKREGINLIQIEGAGHRLEIRVDITASIDILKQIVELY